MQKWDLFYGREEFASSLEVFMDRVWRILVLWEVSLITAGGLE